MALSITSAAEAQEIVKTLRADPGNLNLRVNVAKSLADPNWECMVQAKYVEFCITEADSWSEGEMDKDDRPAWFTSGYEIGMSLQKSNEIAGDYGRRDPKLLLRLRNAVLHKLLKPMLSTVPGAGLQTMLPSAHPSDSEGSLIIKKCIAVAVYTVVDSLIMSPDHRFLEAFCAAGAIEIAAICWYHSDDCYMRNMSAIALNGLVVSTNFKKQAMESLKRHLSVEEIAEKCKESLRDFMVPDRMNTWHQSNLTQLLVNMCDPDPPRGELGRVLSSKGVPEILVEIGRHAINEKIIDWGLIKMLPAPLMLLINGALDPSVVIIELVEHGGILELIGLVFLDKSFVDDRDAWFYLLQLFTHSAACPEISCPLLCSARCTNTISTMLKRDGLWAKISVHLRELVKMKAEEPHIAARKKRLGGWLGIGRVVGLVESLASEQVVTRSGDRGRATRIPRTDEQGCWYARCERHGRIDEETEWMLLRCSLCKRARYCSKGCQSEDWKVVHKLECRSSTASE